MFIANSNSLYMCMCILYGFDKTFECWYRATAIQYHGIQHSSTFEKFDIVATATTTTNKQKKSNTLWVCMWDHCANVRWHLVNRFLLLPFDNKTYNKYLDYIWRYSAYSYIYIPIHNYIDWAKNGAMAFDYSAPPASQRARSPLQRKQNYSSRAAEYQNDAIAIQLERMFFWREHSNFGPESLLRWWPSISQNQ